MSKFVISHSLRKFGVDFGGGSVRRKHLWLAGNIVRSPCEDIVVPNVPLVDFVWSNLDKWPQKTATICGLTERSYSYEQLYKRSRTFSAKLRKLFGVENDDVISVMMPNMPEYPIVIFGIIGAGAIASTINPIYTAHEVSRQIQVSGSKIIVASSEIVPVIKEAITLLNKNIIILSVSVQTPPPDGTASFEEITNDDNVDLTILRDVKRDVNDVCYLPYSSGTTGLPKGVQLTNGNIIANCLQQLKELRQYEYTTESYQESVLAVIPMFHSYGLSIILTQKLAAGCKLVVLPSFKPDIFLNTLVKHKISLLCAAPPMVLFLGSYASVNRIHFETVKTILCGAAPLPQADIERVFDKAERVIDLIHAYGLTESGPLATVSPKGTKDYSTVGVALASEYLKVVDQDSKSLGPNLLGELLIKGPNVMKGYKNSPQADQEVFAEGGWLRSGDQAKIDENGVVTIADRLKELIKVKGYQVPPAELEAVIKEHPQVLDAAVIGVPDTSTGEKPKAFVVLQNKNSKVDEREILEFVNKKVAHYKKIKELMILDSIPKNPSGKILRRMLKEQYC